MIRRSRTATMTRDWEALDRPLAFFGLLLLLSIPLWILGAVVDGEMLPGLPIGALMFLCPAVAASALRLSEGGAAGARALWVSAVESRTLRGNPRLLGGAILLNPLIFALSLWIGRWLGSGAPDATFSIADVATLGVVFLVAAIAEEIGWTGYALGPMQRRWGALRSSVALGVVWAIWHWVVLYQAGRALDWIAWWSLWTVAARVIMVWFYNRAAGSVLIVAIYHAASNVSWQLLPVSGSHFDPTITALVTLPVAIVLARSKNGFHGRFHRRSTTGDTTSCHSEPTSRVR